MLISQDTKHRVLKKSKWSTMFLLLASFQVIAALALLIPCLVHARKIYYLTLFELDLVDDGHDHNTKETYEKPFKVSGECVMFILFEVWRLWLVIDGVIHQNSRTIYATALFTIVSFGFSIALVTESVNWIKSVTDLPEQNSPEMQKLRLINQNLQITLGCIVLVLIPFTFIVARKVTKDFGWDVYKKIGSSIKIQEMFVTVQWLSLLLKIDIYFEFLAYALLFSYNAGFPENWHNQGPIEVSLYIMLIITLLTLPSLMLARLSVSSESNVMMSTFIAFQTLFIASTVFIAIVSGELMRSWYAFATYSLGVLIAAIGTIILSAMCLKNFDKGLKEFVYWRPFMKSPPKRKSIIYNNMHQTNTFYGLESMRADMPIDD